MAIQYNSDFIIVSEDPNFIDELIQDPPIHKQRIAIRKDNTEFNGTVYEYIPSNNPVWVIATTDAENIGNYHKFYKGLNFFGDTLEFRSFKTKDNSIHLESKSNKINFEVLESNWDSKYNFTVLEDFFKHTYLTNIYHSIEQREDDNFFKIASVDTSNKTFTVNYPDELNAVAKLHPLESGHKWVGYQNLTVNNFRPSFIIEKQIGNTYYYSLPTNGVDPVINVSVQFLNPFINNLNILENEQPLFSTFATSPLEGFSFHNNAPQHLLRTNNSTFSILGFAKREVNPLNGYIVKRETKNIKNWGSPSLLYGPVNNLHNIVTYEKLNENYNYENYFLFYRYVNINSNSLEYALIIFKENFTNIEEYEVEEEFNNPDIAILSIGKLKGKVHIVQSGGNPFINILRFKNNIRNTLLSDYEISETIPLSTLLFPFYITDKYSSTFHSISFKNNIISLLTFSGSVPYIEMQNYSVYLTNFKNNVLNYGDKESIFCLPCNWEYLDTKYNWISDKKISNPKIFFYKNNFYLYMSISEKAAIYKIKDFQKYKEEHYYSKYIEIDQRTSSFYQDHQTVINIRGNTTQNYIVYLKDAKDWMNKTLTVKRLTNTAAAINIYSVGSQFAYGGNIYNLLNANDSVTFFSDGQKIYVI